jgi:hypothetical protein
MRLILIPLLTGLTALVIAGWWWYSRQDRFDYAAAFEQADAVKRPMLVDMSQIAGKNADEVQAVLGAPEECEDALYSRRCRYSPGRTEIQFINGKADWITVNGWSDEELAPEALDRIGIRPAEPEEESATELIWRDSSGYKEVRLVGGDGRLSYARIKAITP